MKFLLVPLLIIGMFVSFTAALIAMLFFTHAVRTPRELLDLALGRADTTSRFDEFRLQEDRLEELFQLSEEYKKRYEERSLLAEAMVESLTTERTRLKALEDSLLAEKARLGQLSDSAMQKQREENIKELARFYAKVKPARAAEILQQESELSDTTVAALMKNLPPPQMAKIMGYMNPDFAARITKIMQGSSP